MLALSSACLSHWFDSIHAIRSLQGVEFDTHPSTDPQFTSLSESSFLANYDPVLPQVLLLGPCNFPLPPSFFFSLTYSLLSTFFYRPWLIILPFLPAPNRFVVFFSAPFACQRFQIECGAAVQERVCETKRRRRDSCDRRGERRESNSKEWN